MIEISICNLIFFVFTCFVGVAMYHLATIKVFDAYEKKFKMYDRHFTELEKDNIELQELVLRLSLEEFIRNEDFKNASKCRDQLKIIETKKANE